jgi:hypothetical protein
MKRTALALLVLAACGDPGIAVPDAPPSAALAIGTVDNDAASFLPMAGDQTLVAGAQGGFHVWLTYRVSGVRPGETRVLRTVRRVSDNRLILMADGVQDIGAPGPDGFWQLPAPLPSFMCPAPIGVQVNDELVRFDVTLVDPTTKEVLAEGTAEATPRCPDGAQQAHCLDICNQS